MKYRVSCQRFPRIAMFKQNLAALKSIRYSISISFAVNYLAICIWFHFSADVHVSMRL